MYSELIWTRCGSGIELLKGGSRTTGGGFKMYSCSDRLIKEGNKQDLPFLYKVIQSKESFSDPGLLDDAYIFATPDFGDKYLINFHPIPQDLSAEGTYSHRGGNFINQGFVGSFVDTYPYEIFGNKDIWDAKERGEAYYYENTPSPLPERDLNGSIGYITVDDIASFVADGRREALKHTIAFIISQYTLLPEERKYLVIRDINSRNIELWVAAIESAFSPRMASNLSFATRLDGFLNKNRYTVNLNGRYQEQINLQSPDQKLRYRAMIVGVDERDKNNSNTVKALENLPYVVLDGKTKMLSVNTDTSNPYYQYVTTYDDDHIFLCREFLQMFDVSSPSDDVLKLFAAYTNLAKYSSGRKVYDLVSALSVMSQYKTINAAELRRLYGIIKKEVPTLLKEETVAAFTVMGWLEHTAAVVGDNTVKDSFKDTICRSFADVIFTSPQNSSGRELLKSIKNSTFSHTVSEYITSQATVSTYRESMRGFRPEDWLSFNEYFIDGLRIYNGRLPDTVKTILPDCINVLYRDREEQYAFRIASTYFSVNKEQTIDIILSAAYSSDDRDYQEYLIQLVCQLTEKGASVEKDIDYLCRKLKEHDLDSFTSVVLDYRVQNMTDTFEMERFLKWFMSNSEMKKKDLPFVLESFDRNISVSDKSAITISTKIQENLPDGLECKNSAHIYALDILYDRSLGDNLIPELKRMIHQGFPSIKNEAYAERFIDRLYSTKLLEDVYKLVVTSALSSSYYTTRIAKKGISLAGSRQDYVIGLLFDVLTKTKSSDLYNALVSACSDLKQFDKVMDSISETINSKEARKYFEQVEQEAGKLHEKNRKPSIFERLFARGSSDSDVQEKRKKK